MKSKRVWVSCGFYTHRKTLALRRLLGDDAFWLVPRLWAYALENQPDGDLSGYGSEELSFVLGCSKHSISMLQAFKEAGFIDGNGKIHEWEEHNSTRIANAQRAKTAALARWEKGKKARVKQAISNPVLEAPDAPSIEMGCSKHENGMLGASPPVPPSPWVLEYGLEMPVSLRTNECLESAKLWLAYKRERREMYKAIGLKAALTKWGTEFSAIEFPKVVQQSLSNNWKGLFPMRNPDLFGCSPPKTETRQERLARELKEAMD